MNQFLRFLVLNSLLVAVLIPLSAETGSANDDAELYRQLGEKAGLVKIVDDFVGFLLLDARTESFFATTDRAKLKTNLVDQFCEVSGGPCKYTGKSMKTVHAGLEIKSADFNALVEDLQKAMQKNHVSTRAQNKLLAKLAPMHRDIIEK